VMVVHNVVHEVSSDEAMAACEDDVLKKQW